MTPLRQKFISTLKLHNYSEKTIRQYTMCIAGFARYFGRCPSTLGPPEIRKYLEYLRDVENMSPSRHRQTVAAFRYLYVYVLDCEVYVPKIPYPKREQPLRTFLTPEEMNHFLSFVEDSRHLVMLEVIYGTGVRCGELVRLRAKDIDSKQMVVVVRDGKGHKGRVTLLSKSLLHRLRAYYKEFRPKEWLFESKDGKHLDEAVAQRACNRAEEKSKIGKRVTPQVIRRSFACALHEAGVDVITISRLLGHTHVQTTGVYTDVTLKTIHATKSPFDLL
jgi:site-specific recombinase XerD